MFYPYQLQNVFYNEQLLPKPEVAALQRVSALCRQRQLFTRIPIF
jgi:hypothetical protein